MPRTKLGRFDWERSVVRAIHAQRPGLGVELDKLGDLWHDRPSADDGARMYLATNDKES